MAQSNEVGALRKRIMRRGYKRVRITRTDDGGFWIVADEPLAGMTVQAMFAPNEVSQVFYRARD